MNCKEKEQLLESILDSTPDLIFVKDRALRSVWCNKAYAAAVGKTPREMAGRTDLENGWLPELVRGDPAKGIRGFEADDRDALAGKAVHNPRDPANVGGAVRIFDTLKTPLYGAGGKITGVLGYGRDITERQETEAALAAAEEKYRSIFETSRDALMLLDEKGFLDCNTAALRLFGLSSKEELLGLHPAGLAPALQPGGRPSREAAAEHIACALKEGSVFFEWDHLRADGSMFPAEVLLTRFPLAGRPVLQAVVRDITTRRANLEALLQAREAAEAASRIKSAFLANISHEIRTPMNAIAGFSQVLQSDPAATPDQLRLTGLILENAQALMGLLEKILAAAKLQAGGAPDAAEEIFCRDREPPGKVPPPGGTADLKPELFAALPGGLVAGLRKAALNCDFDLLLELAGRAGAENPAAEAGLRLLAGRFDAQGLLDLLPGGRP